MVFVFKNTIILIMLTSCSFLRKDFLKKQYPEPSALEKVGDKGYLDHINILGNFYLLNEGHNKVNLSTRSEKYLSHLLSVLMTSNELRFKNTDEYHYSIILIKDSKVFYFSLPNKKIVLSTGLVKKYLNNESLLASVLSFELIRSSQGIYPRKTVIPTGAIKLIQLMLFMRLPVIDKVEIHKWAHYIMKRGGYDGDYYLAWLQIQNRNTNDFLYNQGDFESISKEEFLFKGHLIKTLNTKKNSKKITNSADFYYFLEETGKVLDEV